MPESEKKGTKKIRSLATTFTTAFLFLILGIVFVSNGLQLYFNFQTQREVTSGQQNLIAKNAAESVQSFIQERFHMLETAVDMGLLEGEAQEQENVIDRFLGHEQSFRQLALLDTQGQKIVEVSRLSATAPATLEERLEKNLITQARQGKEYFGSVYVDELTSEPMAIMSIPVTNVFGEFQGALVAEVNLKFMWDLVGGIRVGTAGVAYVVDRKGNLIAFGDTARVLKGENLSHLEEVKKFIEGEVPGADTSKFGITKGIQNTYGVSSYVPLVLPDWAVVVELPATEAYQGVIYQLFLTIGIIVLTVGLGAIITDSLSRGITKPIIALRDVAREISGGKLDTKIEIKTKNEIGELAQDFKEMADRLRAYTEELESRVAEKTLELTKRLKELEKGNEDLEEAKLAMLNLLEDARVLGEELKMEKESVERKVEERTRELKEEQARLLASIYSLSLGFILADKNHRILLKNDSINTTLLLPSGNLTMETVAEHMKETVKIMEKGEQCMKEKKTIILGDIEHSGKFLRLLFGPIVMTRDSEEVIGYVLLIEDITEAKLLERARDEFFIIASHELRTPLTAIRGNAEMIQEFFAKKIKNKEVMEMIADVRDASTRLISITNDFLNLSRVEQHKIELKKESIDLAATVGEILQTFKATAEKKHIVFSTTIPSPLPNVWGDKDRVKEVLVNLIGNAVNYTPAGSVTVKIKEQNGKLITYVTDTGIGIAAEKQRFLFRKFQQAGPTLYTRDVTKGTGLGLYISKLLLEDMGGEIKLENSELGEGSTFSFTLPVAS